MELTSKQDLWNSVRITMCPMVVSVQTKLSAIHFLLYQGVPFCIKLIKPLHPAPYSFPAKNTNIFHFKTNKVDYCGLDALSECCDVSKHSHWLVFALQE